MAVVFKSNNPNFPQNQTELNRRLDEVEKLINKPKANIEFVEAAFQLMADCDLITRDNIKFLENPAALKSFDRNFRFPYIPNEGALRCVTNPFGQHFHDNNRDEKGAIRFYHGFDRYVDLNGLHYLISNDWYKDDNNCPNKRAFYNWLESKVKAACNDYCKVYKPPQPVTLEELNKKIDKLTTEVATLNKKVDNLNERFNNLYDALI